MKSLLKAAAAAAALCLAAVPAQAQNINRNAEGDYGRITLRSGFLPDPFGITVLAGGPVDASRVSENCVGVLPERASYTLNYRAGELPLYISATSEGDATILVRAPDGSFHCDDDGAGGLNPGVSFEAPRSGRYQIWVGQYVGDGVLPAVLQVSEVGFSAGASAEAPDWSLDPAYGEVSLTAGFLPDPHTIEIAAGGAFDARGLGAAGCVGYIARAPDYRLHWTGGGSLPLIFSVASEADTTLVINDPNDNWVCDDDGGSEGLNPSVRFEGAPSGQYDIWVGVYWGGELQNSTLHISEVSTR